MNNSPKKPFGIKEIAEKANVSIATVDRVIHKRGGVARRTEELILKIIDEYDYQPNILASRLRSNKTYSLGVIIPQVSENTDFWKAPYDGIRKAEKEIKQFGIEINTYFFRMSQKDSFSDKAKKLLADKPDGVIIAPILIEEATWFSRKLTEERIQYVFIDTFIPGMNNITYIGPHIYHSGLAAGQLAVYAIHNKDDEILVVNHTTIASDGQHIKEIERGFVDYVYQSEKSIPIHTLDVKGTGTIDLENRLQEVLQDHPSIRVIFVTNSRVFKIGAYLKQAGMDHKILIGFDNIAENIKLLKENVIDFLICHQPAEQGYRSVMSLYQSILLGHQIDKMQYMPIDILTKENCDFYPK